MVGSQLLFTCPLKGTLPLQVPQSGRDPLLALFQRAKVFAFNDFRGIFTFSGVKISLTAALQITINGRLADCQIVDKVLFE